MFFHIKAPDAGDFNFIGNIGGILEVLVGLSSRVLLYNSVLHVLVAIRTTLSILY